MAKKDEAPVEAAPVEYDADETAALLAESLRDDPTLTVDQLAQAHEVSHEHVAMVLDEYAVEDGAPRHVGPGGGGGWVAQPE